MEADSTAGPAVDGEPPSAAPSSGDASSNTSATPTTQSEQSEQSNAAGSSSLSPTRPPYIPQFTAVTQMILKRMKTDSKAPISASLSASSVEARHKIPASTYEDVKRRVVMGMTTTATAMTMQMPTPVPLAPAPPRPDAAQNTPALPALAPRKSAGVAGMSAIRRISSGLTASGKVPRAAKTTQAKAGGGGAASAGKGKRSSAGQAASRTLKRKRSAKDAEAVGAAAADDNETSSLSSLTDLSNMTDFDVRTEKEATPPTTALPPPPQPQTPALPPPAPPATVTKSGRQVQKPATYNPAEMDAASAAARRRGGVGGGGSRVAATRTAEQALCRKCTRMHSPASNQMVFCDGCNDGWHQMCHDPWIEDEVVRDPDRAWFCAVCQGKRDRHHAAKRQKAAAAAAAGAAAVLGRGPATRRESWAGRTPQQQRAYLSTLPQQELVGLLMYSLEMYPDLPIFPNLDGGGGGGGSMKVSSPAGPSKAAAAAASAAAAAAAARRTLPSGARSSPGKARSSTNSGGGGAAAAGTGQKLPKAEKATRDDGREKRPEQQQQQEGKVETQEEERDPLDPPWPKPGKGLYARLPPEEEDEGEHLVGHGDFEAFSVIVFDENGKKIEENGIKV